MPEEYVVSKKGPPARGMGTQNNVKMLTIPHSVGILGAWGLQTKYISPSLSLLRPERGTN